MEIIGAIVAVGYLAVCAFFAVVVVIDEVQDDYGKWSDNLMLVIFLGVPWLTGWIFLVCRTIDLISFDAL
jgi:hypothetical protein